jgi:hypothetical protein
MTIRAVSRSVSRILIENHYSRYPKSNDLLAGYSQCRFALSAIYRASGPILVMSSASNRAKSSWIRNSSSMALIISSIPNESITPLNKKSKSSGSSVRFGCMAVIGSEYLVNRNFRTLSGGTSFICLVESTGRVSPRKTEDKNNPSGRRSASPSTHTAQRGGCRSG